MSAGQVWPASTRRGRCEAPHHVAASPPSPSLPAPPPLLCRPRARNSAAATTDIAIDAASVAAVASAAGSDPSTAAGASWKPRPASQEAKTRVAVCRSLVFAAGVCCCSACRHGRQTGRHPTGRTRPASRTAAALLPPCRHSSSTGCPTHHALNAAPDTSPACRATLARVTLHARQGAGSEDRGFAADSPETRSTAQAAGARV